MPLVWDVTGLDILSPYELVTRNKTGVAVGVAKGHKFASIVISISCVHIIALWGKTWTRGDWPWGLGKKCLTIWRLVDVTRDQNASLCLTQSQTQQ